MTEEKALRRLRAGDEAGIAWIMDRYSRLLWKVADGVLATAGNACDVEECVADVFIELWRRPELYKEERGALRSWLCMRARCMAIDRARAIAARREDAEAELPDEVADDAPEGAEQLREGLLQLREGLLQLREGEREMLKRRYCDEEKPSQIAKELGLETKQVENSLYRCKRKLKAILGGSLQ